MKKIKVSIQDEHTLVLQEAAAKGDIVDLKSIHESDIDQTTIQSVVNSIKKEKFEEEVRKARDSLERELALKSQLKERELLERVAQLEQDKLSAVELAKATTKNDLQADLAKKESEAAELRAQKNAEIATLQSKLEIIAQQTASDTKLQALEAQRKIEEKFREQLAEKETQINNIKHQKELESERYQEQLKASETALVSLKEMRTRMSTKMIGESLEIHCENEFNRIRPIAFPRAQFDKDNTVSGTGSKGDYIYRELDEDGQEMLSIMFEMKNEDEATKTKHRNKDFFKELDKDRREKSCEFAVLVSLLEKDNDYYDDIVTVHEYPNMYVIRPQHFITMIGFLRAGSLKSQDLRRQIHALNEQNIDVTNFEQNMNDFKMSFSKRTDLAFDQFTKAIDEIDKSIDRLNKVKDNLMKSGNNLRLANNKAQDLTIKRLTRGNPTMAAKFSDAGLGETSTEKLL